MMKKALSLILALVMILGSFGAVFADGEATPANPEAPAAEAAAEVPAAPAVENAKVKWLQESGLVQGYEDGSLGLDKTITRAEFAAILVRGMGMEDEAKKAMAIPSKFSDMTGHWANGYVEVAVGNGLVKGYPNMTFRPNAQITYAEVVAMLVRATKKISPVEEITAVWPNTYIVKAAQAGILENTLIGNYNESAIREKSFELIYNAMNNADMKGFGNNSVVKAIVLENDRVESIGKKEIVIEYMKVLQESDYVTVVRKSGDIIGKQEKFELDEKVGDVEELLGKVVDFTIDRNGKLINATVDSSYQYLMGGISAGHRELAIDGKKFTVEQREQYNKSEDRLYRTYFNGDDMKYVDFYKMNRDSDTFETEFARVTVKNGKVVFIDAYDFEDIAPVKETKNGGTDVYFYNDMRDGKVDRYTPGKFVITYTEKYRFKRDVKSNIKADDVIHIFKNGVIVKQDAKVEDKLTKTYQDRYGENVVLGSGNSATEAWLGGKPFAPVYSYEQKEYRTLTGRGRLEAIRGRNVKALIAIDGSLQLIDSDLKLQGGVAGINSVLSRGEVRFLPAKGDKYTGAETYDTAYYLKKGSLNRRLLSGFDVNDLVFTSVVKNEKTSQDELEAMFLLQPEEDKTVSGEVLRGYKNLFQSATVDYRYISLKNADGTDGKHYRYMDANINVFGWYPNRGLVQVDFAKLIRNEKDNKELKAFVLSDLDVREIVEARNEWDLYHFISKDPNMANTVVFTGLTTVTDSEFRYAEVIRKDNVTNVIEVRYANNRDYKNAKDEIVRTQELNTNRKDVSKVAIGDIVALGIDKESLKEPEGKMPKLNSITVVVRNNQVALEIEKVDYGTSIKFYGDPKTYFTRLADEFGDSRYNYAQMYVNPKDKYGEYINVIRYRSRGGVAPVANDLITFINKAEKTITVDHKTAYVLDEFVELKKDGELFKGYTAVVNQLMVGDKIERIRRESNGRVYFLEVSTAKEVLEFIKAVAELEVKVAAINDATPKAELNNLKSLLAAQRKAYNALAMAQKEGAKVVAAEEKLSMMETKVQQAIELFEAKVFMAKVEALQLKANELKSSTDKAALVAFQAKLAEARAEYNALTAAQKKAAAAAETALAKMESDVQMQLDKIAAKAFEDSVAALKNEAKALEGSTDKAALVAFQKKLQAARAKYDALTDTQKAMAEDAEMDLAKLEKKIADAIKALEEPTLKFVGVVKESTIYGTPVEIAFAHGTVIQKIWLKGVGDLELVDNDRVDMEATKVTIWLNPGVTVATGDIKLTVAGVEYVVEIQ